MMMMIIIFEKGEIISLLQRAQTESRAHPLSCSMSIRGKRRMEREDDHFTPSSVGLRMNETILPLLHMPS